MKKLSKELKEKEFYFFKQKSDRLNIYLVLWFCSSSLIMAIGGALNNMTLIILGGCFTTLNLLLIYGLMNIRTYEEFKEQFIFNEEYIKFKKDNKIELI